SVSNVKGAGSNSFPGDSNVGVRITGATGGLNFYFNSFGLFSGSFAGSATGTLSGAFYIGASALSIDMKDNVFFSNLVNSNAAAAKTYAIYSDAPASAFLSNNNDLFATGSQGVLGFVGGADRTTLLAWQTATGGDAASISADPLFNSPTNLQPGPGSPLVGAGAPAGGVTIDLLGAARNALTPTIGAYENAADTSGPVINYTPLANTTSTSNRNLTAAITDPSGVPTSGVGLPVLYWRKNAGSYNSAQGTFVSGSNYSFLFDYSLVGGVVAGDTVSYYIAAQDTFGPPNVSVNPSVGASGLTANPPAAATPPSPPNSYNIQTAISGIKTVCASGCDFTTLTGAGGVFAAINTRVATG